MTKILNRALKLCGQEQKIGTPYVKILEFDVDGQVSRANGATVPTNADAGYAKGCIFTKTDGGVATTVYINEGSATSADFNAIESSASTITGVTAGAGLTGGGTEGTVTLNVINTDTNLTVGADTIDFAATLSIGSTTITGATGADGNGLLVNQTPGVTGKHQGIKVVVTQSAAGDDSNSGVRADIVKSTTAAIGNLYGGRFAIDMQALPTSQGHTTGLFIEGKVSTGINLTSVATFSLTGAAGGGSTPVLLLQDNSTDKTNTVMTIGSTDNLFGTGAKDNTKAVATGLTGATAAGAITASLRVNVNGTVYYIPLMAEGGLA